MQEIKIKNQSVDDLLNQLNQIFKGTITNKWGQSELSFDNSNGKGTIKTISFDWGVSLIDFDVKFSEEIKIVHEIDNNPPIEFIFISDGMLTYLQNDAAQELVLERFQNIIISPRKKSSKTFIFPKGIKVKLNSIQILKKQYAKKRHHNLNYLNEVLMSVFNEDAKNLPFKHLGSFNLKIADQVKEMNIAKAEGMAHTLGLEGRLNIILAMQLIEHHKFENDEILPESLTPSDIKKIHKLSEYIVDNISEPMTIGILTKESGLSSKKLQLGFRMLYAKSVNEYIKKMKLEISRDYLKNTDLTISEVVYRVGIRSRSYFSKIFSEYYGILPIEYRRKLKKRKIKN